MHRVPAAILYMVLRAGKPKNVTSMAEQLVKKKRMRAGHKASTSRIVALVKTTIESPQVNSSLLKRMAENLREKLATIMKLDEEILESLTEEGEITDEIETADIYREKVDLAIIELESEISAIEQHEASKSQPPLASTPRGTRTAEGVQSSTVNSDVTASVEDRTPERSATSPHVSTVQTAEPAQTARRAPRVKLPKVELKRFDGVLTNWATFWDMFQSSVHNNSELTDIDRFNYLHSLLEDSAADAISGLSITTANYAEAITILQKRFGNKQQVVNRHMDALLEIDAVTSMRDLRRLRHLYDQAEGHIRSLNSLGVPSESYGNLLAPILMKRFPHELCVIISKDAGTESWNLDKMMKIAEKEIEARERAAANDETSTTHTTPTRRSGMNRDRPTASTLVTTNSSPLSCYYCGEQHLSTSCRKVTNPEARKQILLKAGRCFVCLRKGHVSRDCRSPLKCTTCHGRHHVTICDRARRPSPASSDPSMSSHQSQQPRTPTSAVNRPGTNTSTLSMYVDARTPVLLQTATTMVYKKSRPAVPLKARLILDSGSQKSYISADLRSKLKLPSEQSTTLSIKTFGAQHEKTQICDAVELGLKTKLGSDLELTLYVVPFICEPLSGQPTNIAVERFRYLSGLDLADPDDTENLSISILIGADYYWKVVTGKIIHGRVGPTAVQTKFGWVLSGPVTGLRGSSTMSTLCSHVLRVECTPQHDLSDLDKKLQAFWELDSMGIMPEEDSVYSRFTKSVTLQQGRYCVRLPWKEPHPLLPDNFELSKGRLFNLLKRLQSTPDILSQYDAIIREQMKSGIVETVTSPGGGPIGRVHYLPHHAVVREDKETTKLRVVYDASARSDGPALNDCLYSGPTFGQNILDILLRFRLYRVAVTADVEKAFLMVSVAEEDRDVLRFLWVDNISSPLPKLVTLRFARVVFGVSSSPFLLNATLQHHIERYTSSDPSFVDTFIRSIYVDDLTSRADNEEEALRLATKARERLGEAGFNLRKFVTNVPALQKCLSSLESQHHRSGHTENPVTCDDQSYTKNTLGDMFEAPEFVKVLGVKWKPLDDQLVCDLSSLVQGAVSMKPTKRNIIGLSARFYDPLGFLSPVSPADIPSRGIELSQLVDSALWMTGPTWISDPDFEPQCPDLHTVPDECLIETKVRNHSTVSSLLTHDTCQSEAILNCEQFSTLGRLLRVTAHVMKFISILKSRVKSCLLTAEDVGRAEIYWVKESQKMLTQSEQFSLWQQQLGLYCGVDGIWKCKGRLGNADLPELMKHPMFLDKKHHFTRLVVRECHTRLMHGGVKETLTQMRSKYWIVRGRQFVRMLLNECKLCKRYNSRPLSGPPSPPLPEYRVQVSPPFSATGVDYAGPLYLKGGEKVWISLFTCCAVRAVHLELVPDLTAMSFVRCLKRFSARRGVPQVICSDTTARRSDLRTRLSTPYWTVQKHNNTSGIYAYNGSLYWRRHPGGKASTRG